MRLHLKLTASQRPVPFGHLPRLVGALHKWAGENNTLHEGPSLYSIGWLRGGKVHDGDLHFSEGAQWSISFFREAVADKVRQGIAKDNSVVCGMSVYNISQSPTPSLGNFYRFEVGSPVLARQRRDEGGRQHLLHDDPEADAALTRTLRTKLRVAGFDDPHLDVMVGFDRSYTNPRTKVVQFKEAEFKANLCPVIVAGTPEAVRFAYDVGVGELTGCCMGFLKSVT